jgi:hypothetical protein
LLDRTAEKAFHHASILTMRGRGRAVERDAFGEGNHGFFSNWLAVILAAVLAWLFGAAWYMGLSKP